MQKTWVWSLGRSPGEGNGNSLQYSSLENSTNRGAWRAIVHGVAKSQTPLSMHTHTHTHTCVCICVFWAQHLESYISNCHYYDKDKGNTRSYEIAQLEDLILSMGWKMSHIANYASSWYLKTGLTAIKREGKQNMQNLWHRKASTVF